MDNRGTIRHRGFAGQLLLFTRMVWGKITPTNIDMFVEFSDRLYCFAEAKHGLSWMLYGQRLGLERLTRRCHAPPHCYAILFTVSHSADGDVVLADCVVTRYFWEGRWSRPSRSMTLKEAIDHMREWVSRVQEKPL